MPQSWRRSATGLSITRRSRSIAARMGLIRTGNPQLRHRPACPGDPYVPSAVPRLGQIAPAGILLRDQVELPSARILLDPLFAMDGVGSGGEGLEIDQQLHAIGFGEPGHQTFTVLISTAT